MDCQYYPQQLTVICVLLLPVGAAKLTFNCKDFICCLFVVKLSFHWRQCLLAELQLLLQLLQLGWGKFHFLLSSSQKALLQFSQLPQWRMAFHTQVTSWYILYAPRTLWMTLQFITYTLFCCQGQDIKAICILIAYSVSIHNNWSH